MSDTITKGTPELYPYELEPFLEQNEDEDDEMVKEILSISEEALKELSE